MKRPEWYRWLAANIRASESDLELPRGLTLGALTGQDIRALDAVAACWVLCSSSDDNGRTAALAAVSVLLPGMQPQCKPFARELIAWAMDWSDRAKLWPIVDPEAARKLRLVAAPSWKWCVCGVARGESDGVCKACGSIEFEDPGATRERERATLETFEEDLDGGP